MPRLIAQSPQPRRPRTGEESTVLTIRREADRVSYVFRRSWSPGPQNSAPRTNGYNSGGGGGYSRPAAGGANNWETQSNGSAGGGWGKSTPSWDKPASTRSYSSSGGGAGLNDGHGVWKDGQHIQGHPNKRIEAELFGTAEKTVSTFALNYFVMTFDLRVLWQAGINFDKYEDIPIEVTGKAVPEPVQEFSNPPLHQYLLDNVRLASYSTPTPVQRYSIPIVAQGIYSPPPL